MPSLRPFAVAFVLWCGLLALPNQARSGDVDVALVLAVDISNSMDPDEQALQREGFIAAFRSPLVHQVIRSGILGRIAVSYVEWAASTNQQIVVPWTEMEDAEDAIGFAELLARAPIRRAPRTSISGAIDFSVGLLQARPGNAMRQVIDISGDGANNQGRKVTDARDEAVAKGFTINGLPLLLKSRSPSAILARRSARMCSPQWRARVRSCAGARSRSTLRTKPKTRSTASPSRRPCSTASRRPHCRAPQSSSPTNR